MLNSTGCKLLGYIGSYSNTLLITYILYSITFRGTTLKNVRMSVTKQALFFIWLLLFNMMINVILKNIIQEPRPDDKSKYGIGYEYGMPSGHAQISTFLLLILFSIKAPQIIRLVAIILTLLIYTHRYVFMYHSINQIIGGIIVGGVLWKVLL